jgi:hypothetical protein
MKYSHEIQEEAIEKAAKRLSLDSHITYYDFKVNLYTFSDKLMTGNLRRGMPFKRSFMMCESMDMNFFFNREGEPIYTYAGYADNRDATEEKIVNAFRKANKMREYMQEEAEKLLQEVQQ